MKSLHSQDIRPISFEELKQELQKANFKHTSKLFDETVELSAEDEENFQIPFASETGTECIFDLVDSRGRKPRPGSRPSAIPLQIETQGLEPLNFSVHWKRMGKEYIPTFHSR